MLLLPHRAPDPGSGSVGSPPPCRNPVPAAATAASSTFTVDLVCSPAPPLPLLPSTLLTCSRAWRPGAVREGAAIPLPSTRAAAATTLPRSLFAAFVTICCAPLELLLRFWNAYFHLPLRYLRKIPHGRRCPLRAVGVQRELSGEVTAPGTGRRIAIRVKCLVERIRRRAQRQRVSAGARLDARVLERHTQQGRARGLVRHGPRCRRSWSRHQLLIHATRGDVLVQFPRGSRPHTMLISWSKIPRASPRSTGTSAPSSRSSALDLRKLPAPFGQRLVLPESLARRPEPAEGSSSRDRQVVRDCRFQGVRCRLRGLRLGCRCSRSGVPRSQLSPTPRSSTLH